MAIDCKVSADGKKLTITVDIEKGVPSSTGKSETLASTRGNVKIPGTTMKLGLNVFRPLERK